MSRATTGTQDARLQVARLEPERVQPAPNSLVGDLDAVLGEQVFDDAVAQGESQVHPDSAVDTSRRKRYPE
jgi:hypothetical protein